MKVLFYTAGKTALPKWGILMIVLFLTISPKSYSQTENPNDDAYSSPFLTKITALRSGELSKMSLEFMDSIKIKFLIGEKIDDRDAKRYKSGYLRAGQLQEIGASSICEITDKYILLVVEDEFSQLRALTVLPDGTPIECVLIYDRMLYVSRDWHEYEARRYSPARAYHYDPRSHEFTFSTIFKIRAPQHEETLIDFKDHEDETTNRRRIKVNEEGLFDQPSYEIIHTNAIYFQGLTLKSSFFEENSGKIRSNQSYHFDDSIKRIYLDQDQSAQLFNNAISAHDQIIRIIPDAIGEIEVSQRITYGLNLMGDGDNCELDSPVVSSNWEKLEMMNDLVSLRRYGEKDRINPQISVSDLKSKIKKQCGNYHHSLTNDINRPEDISSLVRPREVTLRIYFTNAEKTINTTEYVIFVLANGC